ncbi:MAG: hypothetical protein KF838_13695 [Phycisphaeraceae bacterium]|nr:MAG: hypothetical protein KF838_13695 [Phycisphaeraceae bacterium]
MSKQKRFNLNAHDWARHLPPSYLASRVRRRIHIFVGAIMTPLFVVLISWFATTISPDRVRIQILCLLAFCACSLAYLAWILIRWTSAARRAKSMGWQLCPVCLYDLSGDGCSPDADAMLFVCPECGGRYDMDDLRTAWAAGQR